MGVRNMASMTSATVVTHPRRHWLTVIAVSLLMLLLLLVFIVSPNAARRDRLVPAVAWAVLLSAATAYMLRTGRFSKIRAMFFITYGLAFILAFTTDLVEQRGSLAVSEQDVAANKVPLCPVALPTLIAPAFIKGVLIFPTRLIGGPYGGFVPILLLWLVAVVALGRAWCSWGCFYGGIDEGFSRLAKTVRLRTAKLPARWRSLPFAILLVVVVWAFAAMSPVYCDWLCPLKLVTEHTATTTVQAYVQAVIFISLGMSLLIVLPILTKKRTHCGLFCPLGALQSLLGVANPYRVKLDAERCNGCGKCARDCPTFSITSRERGQPSIAVTCTRCAQCVDHCPTGALSLGLIGTASTLAKAPLSRRWLGPAPGFFRRLVIAPVRLLEEALDGSTLFVVTALLFGAILSGSFVPDAVTRLAHLVRHGSLLMQ